MRLVVGRKQQNEGIYGRSLSVETEYLIATAICFCGLCNCHFCQVWAVFLKVETHRSQFALLVRLAPLG